MNDESLDNLLREWSDDHLPDETKRKEILRNVFEETRTIGDKRFRIIPHRRGIFAAVIAALWGVAATILFIVATQEDRMHGPFDPPENSVAVQNEPETGKESIRVSILVLRRMPGSESGVEFLEDAVLIAEEQKLHEIEFDGHRMFLWIYPLEKTLYSLDVGIDKVAETGIVAVPDRSQVLQFNSNGDCFDVFISVLPNS